VRRRFAPLPISRSGQIEIVECLPRIECGLQVQGLRNFGNPGEAPAVEHERRQAGAAVTLDLAGSTAALAETRNRAALFAALCTQPWVVNAKRPIAGPSQVLQYLGRYTHRIALTNNRFVSLNHETVAFRYKDYASGNRRKVMSLGAQEFIRRFHTHVLPHGFMRIRHYELLGNRAKHHRLAQARTALNAPRPEPLPTPPESIEAFWLRIAQLDIH
jgi:hypothetical protein